VLGALQVFTKSFDTQALFKALQHSGDTPAYPDKPTMRRATARGTGIENRPYLD
jgi:hypothetical protein